MKSKDSGAIMNIKKINRLIIPLLLGYSSINYAQPIEARELLKTTKSWNGASLPSFGPDHPEFNIVNYKLAPKTKTPVHLHPMNGAGYIISGELTLYSTTDPHGDFSDISKVKKITLKAGQAWTETVNTWHYGENNSDKDVELVIFFAGAKNTPLSLSMNTKSY
ncbi:MAG: cupin domain-containing protein [Legionella sp.]|nr:MAG: cupin domain-containing protein [Legionella sp.]